MGNDFRNIYIEACTAGHEAGMACTPKPMRVRYGRPGEEKVEVVDDGVCGFAWVNIPGNTRFARWAKAENVARPDYPKGLCFWISDHDQSLERKSAHATAFAEVLRKYGIKANARNRID